MSLSSPTAALGASGDRLRIDSRPRWFPNLKELYRYRRLITLFGRRDITARYRQTVLGTVWIFTGPLVTAGLFSFVFGRIAGLPSDGDPYFAFSYAGLLGWNLFSNTLTSAASSVGGNAGLITKIYFPRLVVPLATLPWTLLNIAIGFVIMLVLLLVYGIGFSFQLLLLPVWMLLAIMLAIGIGLVLTSFAVSYRDVNDITPIFTSLLMYLSPVAYSTEAVPANLRNLYLLNPLTSIVEGFRWSLLGNASLSAWGVAYTIGMSLVALTLGLAVFARLESRFADVI